LAGRIDEIDVVAIVYRKAEWEGPLTWKDGYAINLEAGYECAALRRLRIHTDG
jgi:hypothetical protein